MKDIHEKFADLKDQVNVETDYDIARQCVTVYVFIGGRYFEQSFAMEQLSDDLKDEMNMVDDMVNKAFFKRVELEQSGRIESNTATSWWFNNDSYLKRLSDT